MKKINKFQEFKADIPLDIQISVLEQAMQIQQGYIKDLEEQLTLTDVMVAERTLNCNHEWINNTHKKTKYCRKGCAGFDEIGI